MSKKSKHSLKSIVRKILAAFVLGSAAIVLSVYIARFSFRELLSTVDELSHPNEKLTLLNSMFEKITTLDQVQRAQAIANPNKPYSTFIDQSVYIEQMIDSLHTFRWNSAQLSKLDSMKGILNERSRLFFSYLKVKAELMENKEFSIQLDTLALILAADEITFDSTLISAQIKTTTTFFRDSTRQPTAQQRSFLKRLFSKKKPVAVDTPKIKVQQEQTYVVDTFAIARQLAAIAEIERIMKSMDADQRSQRRRLQRQELELINANSQLINQLLNILHEVENEELANMRKTNTNAVAVMNESMSRINMLMLGFFLAAALLIYLIWIDVGRTNYYKEQLEQARDRAEELSQIKQRFLANMSHEIRTPLQSIIGFAEQMKLKSNGKMEELDAIYSSSEHLLQIVNEVLDYSRISSGNFSLAKDKFQLHQVIKEVESSMRVQAERKNLSFVIDREKAMDFTLLGDAFRLRQVLYNVIGNAIKFTHKGFVKLVLRTTEHDDSVSCIFEVIDSGIGIEKKDLEKVFNQFEQANTSIASHYGGTGLGLSIVKSLVEAQQGSIELSSEPGIGTSFLIRIPFEKAPAAVVTKNMTNQVSAESFGGKVMVVDDDALILRLCALILKRFNVDYITYNHGRTLLSQRADEDVTHILLDIRMPDISGIELCQALRKIYPSETKFIALTAHVLPEEQNTLLAAGFDSILSKPFHERELTGALGITGKAEDEFSEKADLSVLRKMTMGDEVLFQSIISQFMDETIDDCRKIKTLMQAEDSAALREVVHKMSGRFAQVGLKKIGSALKAIEHRLVDGERVTTLKGELPVLLSKIEEAMLELRLSLTADV